MRKKVFLTMILILLVGARLSAQRGPLVYILPATNRVIIVLGDIPRDVYSFEVYRKSDGDKNYKLLNKHPISEVKDPYTAKQLMGEDFIWISKRVGSDDPSFVWNRLKANRNTTRALLLISHGLRLAMGKTYIDRGVKPGKSYSYRVVLYNSIGREIQRIERRIRVTPPKTPQKPGKVRAKASDGEVKIEWDYPKYRGGEKDRTVGFIIYRDEGDGNFIRINQAPVLRIEGWLAYIDNNVVNGKTYTYGVKAIDIIGVKSKMSYSPRVKPRDTRAPLVPMGLKAIDDRRGVLLLWNISPEIDAAYYNVYRSQSLKGTFKKINKTPIAVDNPQFIDSERIGGQVYYYRVTAIDLSGNESPKSGPVSIIPKDTTPPSKVEGISFTINEKERKVTLKWEASKATDLKGYYIYRGSDRKRMVRIVGKPLKPTKNPSFRDSGYKSRGLQPGINLIYAITAVDTSGNESERSYTEVQIPDNVPPSPVFFFTAKPTDEGWVKLFWQPSLSRDLALHRIYRKAAGGRFKSVKELDKKITSWSDKDVIRGREYNYRITEVDKSGNESKPSKIVTIVPTDIIPPKSPTNLRAEITAWGVSIEWDPSPSKDVAGYHVYRAKYRGSRWERLTGKPIEPSSKETEEKKLKFLDMWHRGGEIYGVSAIDTSGNESTKATIRIKKKEAKK